MLPDVVLDGGFVAAVLSGVVGLLGTAGGIAVQLRGSSGAVSQALKARATTAEEDAEELRQELVTTTDDLVAARRELTRLRLLLADHGLGDADGSVPAPRQPS